jgi:hypothetical protein
MILIEFLSKVNDIFLNSKIVFFGKWNFFSRMIRYIEKSLRILKNNCTFAASNNKEQMQPVRNISLMTGYIHAAKTPAEALCVRSAAFSLKKGLLLPPPRKIASEP